MIPESQNCSMWTHQQLKLLSLTYRLSFRVKLRYLEDCELKYLGMTTLSNCFRSMMRKALPSGSHATVSVTSWSLDSRRVCNTWGNNIFLVAIMRSGNFWSSSGDIVFATRSADFESPWGALMLATSLRTSLDWDDMDAEETKSLCLYVSLVFSFFLSLSLSLSFSLSLVVVVGVEFL